MRSTVLIVAALVGSMLVAAPQATAQTAQLISIQGSLLGAALGGDAFETDGITFEPGSGGEVQIRWNPSALSVGVGAQYTSHNVTVAGVTGVDVTLEFSGVFIEPRYVIFVGSEKVAPYLSARIISLVSTLSIPSAGLEEDFSAVSANVGGGFLVSLSSRANLDIGLTAGGITFVYDDPALDPESGTSAVFRLGLAVGL